MQGRVTFYASRQRRISLFADYTVRMWVDNTVKPIDPTIIDTDVEQLLIDDSIFNGCIFIIRNFDGTLKYGDLSKNEVQLHDITEYVLDTLKLQDTSDISNISICFYSLRIIAGQKYYLFTFSEHTGMKYENCFDFGADLTIIESDGNQVYLFLSDGRVFRTSDSFLKPVIIEWLKSDNTNESEGYRPCVADIKSIHNHEQIILFQMKNNTIYYCKRMVDGDTVKFYLEKVTSIGRDSIIVDQVALLYNKVYIRDVNDHYLWIKVCNFVKRYRDYSVTIAVSESLYPYKGHNVVAIDPYFIFQSCDELVKIQNYKGLLNEFSTVGNVDTIVGGAVSTLDCGTETIYLINEDGMVYCLSKHLSSMIFPLDYFTDNPIMVKSQCKRLASTASAIASEDW